ncbi:hypothetical protein DICVIV_02302 [Dictyocaulus viviparus]|uniref:Uncharacterized protein n=1 Tax=Dictyocaulus viviparus TaxID=29172 RepID=A0A0D8Y4B5_DICVI|nr:hypothetical protein DICVIV_02302 [Dictyocaulus viviparus]
MKFTDSILTLVGDFAAMKRTPDYIPSNFPVEAQPMKSENNKSNNTRRHSLHISVGTEEIPKLGRNRSESVFSPSTLTDSKIYNKSDRRSSFSRKRIF